MKFSVGDPVYVKSSGEEGQLVEFISHDVAKVRVKNQEFHAFLDDLEHPYLRWFLNKNKNQPSVTRVDQIRADKSQNRDKQLDDGMYLLFVPQFVVDEFDEEMTHLKIYFYNESAFSYQVHYQCNHKSERLFDLPCEVLPQATFYIHDISFEAAASNPEFVLRFVRQDDARLDWEGRIVLKAKKFQTSVHQVRHENKPSFHIQIFDYIKPREQQEVVLHHNIQVGSLDPIKNPSHFDFRNALKKSKYEVDLHIEKLVKDFRHLSPSLILEIQLKECRNALDLAIATHQHALVLIHGVGNGKLKNEIHRMLKQTKNVKRYVYDFDSRYGYGATEVFF